MLYLLDSSAVLNDFSFEFSAEHSYITTPPIMDEFKDMRSRHLVENALQRGLLRLAEPSPQSLKKIQSKISEKGFSRVSRPDISLLSLALDLKNKKEKFLLISDDYSIQNFCKLLKIPFEGVIRGEIKETISFSLKCQGCGKTLSKGSKLRKCPVCATGLIKVRK